MRKLPPKTYLALLLLLLLPGCDGMGRAIGERILEVVAGFAMFVGVAMGLQALVFAGLSIRGLRRPERSKIPLLGTAFFGLPLIALSTLWVLWALIEDVPLVPELLPPVAAAVAWAFVFPLATRAGFESRTPLVIVALLAAGFVLLQALALLLLWPRPDIPSGPVVQVALGTRTLCARFEGGEVLCDGTRGLREHRQPAHRQPESRRSPRVRGDSDRGVG